MPIKLKCPSCGHTERVSDDVLGKKVHCSSCGAGFRVAAPKPSASAAPAPAATGARPGATIPEPSADPAEYAVVPPEDPVLPPVVLVPRSSPVIPKPRPSLSQKRSGVPPWVYAAAGGAGVMVLIVGAVLIRLLGGFGSSQFPDPSVDVALGVASLSGPQSPQPVAAPPAPVSNSLVAATAPGAVAPNPPSAPVAPATSPAASPAAPGAKGAPLTTAEIVARCEPSVALVKGHASSGTGFLVKQGIVATNAHVIGGEFMSSLEVRFPSAPEGKQGPFPAELLYEDSKRDLAFLAVSSDLAAIDIAPSYSFVKGDDVLVIGNPSLGDEVVLQNAISRGVMSSKAVVEGMNYLQLSMAVNPGNSGGPVFDSSGHVIGVVTLKATKAEALAFCIPVEDLHAALAQVGPARPDLVSHHRAEVAFRLLTVAGALYGIGLDVRADLLSKTPAGGAKPNLLPNEGIQKLDEVLTTLDEKLFSLVGDEMPGIKADAALAEPTRNRYQDLFTNYIAMKGLYSNTNRPADKYASQVQALRAKHLRVIESLQKDLKMEVRPDLLALLKARASDGQSQALAAQIVPPRIQSRLRSRSAISQRGAAGSRTAGAQSPAQSAKDKMQNRRDARNNRRGNN
jgi:S1-C subfamily serine protease